MLKSGRINAYIPASDVERARSFYEATIGLVPKQVEENGVTYECAGGTIVFLYLSAGAGTSSASCAFWDVADVEAEVTELKRRGVVFEEYDMPGVKTQNSISVGGGAKAAWFKDTEGNIMAIVQSLEA